MRILLTDPDSTLDPTPDFSGETAENPKKQAIASFVA